MQRTPPLPPCRALGLASRSGALTASTPRAHPRCMSTGDDQELVQARALINDLNQAAYGREALFGVEGLQDQ